MIHASKLSGAEGRALPSHNQFTGRSGLAVIQECRADLQAFLRSTRSRLEAIAKNIPECDDRMTDGDASNRLLRGSDGTEPLRPLPILAPPPRRDPTAQLGSQEKTVAASIPIEPMTVRFEPFSPLQSGKDETDNDWRLSNGFDRNSYFGPTDFLPARDTVADVPVAGPLATAEIAAELSRINTISAHSVTRSVDSIIRIRSSRLHLANQIRNN